MKFLLDLEHREENVQWSVFNDFIGVNKKNLKKLAKFFILQSISILAICSQRWLILVSVH